jgi:hypothetical protein
MQELKVKLVMTLLVHDEAHILEQNLIYHLSRGVDGILAIDDESSDGSREVLESFVGGGWVTVVPRPPGLWKGSGAAWRTHLARLAATEHGADWVIPGDPDEFWWPVVGNLKQALSRVSDPYELVMAPSTDFVFTADPVRSALQDLTTREVSSPLASKVAFRTSPDVVLDEGSHRAERDASRDRLTRWDVGQPMRVSPVFPLRIFHFGITSSATFERGVGRRGHSAGWRRDVLLRHAGNKQLSEGPLDPLSSWRRDALERGLREGTLVVDERFARLAGDLHDPRELTTGGRTASGTPAIEGDFNDDPGSLSDEGMDVQQLVLEAIQRRDAKLRWRAGKAIQREKNAARRGLGGRLRALLENRKTRPTPGSS